MYKVVIVIASCIMVLQASLTDEQKDLLKLYHEQCLEYSGVAEDLVKKAREGDFEDDPNLKEHFFCVSKKLAFQNEAGEIQEEVIKAKLLPVIEDEDKVEDLVKKCAIKKDTPQDTAYDTFKCYFAETRVD